MTRLFIKSMGVELEGAWQDLPTDFFKNSHVYRYDGSLNGMNEYSCSNCDLSARKHKQGETSCNKFEPNINNISDSEDEKYFNFVGELASTPFDKLSNCCKWVKTNYPIYFNHSCSIHIHLKPINDLMYNLLMSKKYYKYVYNCLDYFVESRSIEKGTDFYKRVKGLNVGDKNSTNYCKKAYSPLKSNGEDSDRYHGINYCKNKHNTIEIRIGALFKNPDITIDYIKFIVDITNGFLLRNYKPFNYKSQVILN